MSTAPALVAFCFTRTEVASTAGGSARIWAPIATQAGLNVSYHSLRHFHASVLLAHGASIVAVSKALGHGTPAITLNVYAHLMQQDAEKVAKAVDAVFQATADASRTEATV